MKRGFCFEKDESRRSLWQHDSTERSAAVQEREEANGSRLVKPNAASAPPLLQLRMISNPSKSPSLTSGREHLETEHGDHHPAARPPRRTHRPPVILSRAPQDTQSGAHQLSVDPLAVRPSLSISITLPSHHDAALSCTLVSFASASPSPQLQ